MNHPAELAVYTFLQLAMDGKAKMTDEVTDMVASDVKAALNKQFNSGPREEFRLRMSNIGKPKCQLWFEKNDPEDQIEKPPHFMMTMILGDIIEAVFKGLLRASNIEFKDNDTVKLDLPNGKTLKGEYDMELDGKIDDVKSASPWSYNNKFVTFDALSEDDSFGYIPQLVGYALAADKEVGGWWVVNKSSGEFKYLEADNVDVEKVKQDIVELVDYIDNDEPFERCFEAVPETYYGKQSGNLKLNPKCQFCNFKYKCWDIKTLPSRVYKGTKQPPEVDYIFIGDGLGEATPE